MGYLFVVPCHTGWPMEYLFVVPYNTDWPIKHCPHPHQVGHWGIYLWSHTTPVGQWGTYLWSHATPVGQLFVVPYNTGWPIKHCTHPHQVGQWSIHLWSHTTPVGQLIIVPIPIRLANGVFICCPIQHRLANQALSPSTSGWPIWYLFVVPYNTGWPTKHCLHPNQVGQWGTYLWSHATANWLGVTWDDKISTPLVNQCRMEPQINTLLANLIEMGTMLDWPTGVVWDHKWVPHWPT